MNPLSKPARRANGFFGPPLKESEKRQPQANRTNTPAWIAPLPATLPRSSKTAKPNPWTK
jgi:hypothetical protein